VASYLFAMPATNTKQSKPRSSKRTKYARARVKAGLTCRALTAMGFGMATVANADRGKLPKHPAISAAYLKAIGLEAKS
jgi:hypothetical protein